MSNFRAVVLLNERWWHPMERRLFCIAVVALLMTGCQLFGISPRDGELEELERQIEALIGDAEASAVGQCRHMAFGSKPCGGPWTYLIYSTEATDTGALQRLVDRYNELDAERNRKEGLISDCALAPIPDLALVGGQCVAASPGDVIPLPGGGD